MNRILAKGRLELKLIIVQKVLEYVVIMWNLHLEKSGRLKQELKALKTQQEMDLEKAVEEAEEAVEVKWMLWAEKES